MKEILKTAFVALLVIAAAIVVANTRGSDKLDWNTFKLDFKVQEDTFAYEIVDSEFNGIYQNVANNKNNTYIMLGKNASGSYRVYFVKKVGIKSIVLRLDDLVIDSNGTAGFQNNEGSSMTLSVTNNQINVKGSIGSVGDKGISGVYSKVRSITKFAMSEFNI